MGNLPGSNVRGAPWCNLAGTAIPSCYEGIYLKAALEQLYEVIYREQ